MIDKSKKLSALYRSDLPTRLVAMEREALDLGLIKTAAQINQASHAIGYELTELRERLGDKPL